MSLLEKTTERLHAIGQRSALNVTMLKVPAIAVAKIAGKAII